MMSRSLDPFLLTMAISLPSASQALGLGDIHVVSELNQPLSARIDLLGASAEELAGLHAAVASRESFASYGADRPSFLSSTYFKVGVDGRGHPVLEVHSTEAFTEPLVSLFVEVRWGTGNLVREYTLLLDPAGFPAPVANDTMVAADVSSNASPQGASTAPVAALAATATTAGTAPAGDADSAPRRITVARRDTLGSIARRAIRARGELRRTMIAIYRANPDAFAGNINRLRRGATLLLPAREAIAAISKAEANREFQSQMAAWRSAGGGVAAKPSLQASATATGTTATGATPASTAAGASPEATPTTGPAGADDPSNLESRIASLEQALEETNRMLAAKHAEVLDMQQQVALAEAKAAATASPAPVSAPGAAAGTAAVASTGAAAAPAHPTMTLQSPAQAAPAAKPAAKPATINRAPTTAGGAGTALVAAVAASLVALISAGFAILRLRLRRNQAKAAGGWQSTRIYRHGDQDDTPLPADDVLDDSQAGAMLGMRSESAPLPAPHAPRTAHETNRAATAPRAPLQIVPTQAKEMTGTHESTTAPAETVETHVLMPSGLTDAVVFKERRSNAIDVLRQAIEREPGRRDLRLKLLELYHAAAATNRQAFLEAARDLAHDPAHAETDEWTKVTTMGRQIALDDALFSTDSAHEGDVESAEPPGNGSSLADCA